MSSRRCSGNRWGTGGRNDCETRKLKGDKRAGANTHGRKKGLAKLMVPTYQIIYFVSTACFGCAWARACVGDAWVPGVVRTLSLFLYFSRRP